MPALVNNIDITDVVFNGGDGITDIVVNSTLVWTKTVPFSYIWSGNSLALGTTGIQTSGNLLRACVSGAVGSWITTNSGGTFTNVLSSASGMSIQGNGTNVLSFKTAVSGPAIDTVYLTYNNVTNTWSGGGTTTFYDTRAGQARQGMSYDASGSSIRARSNTYNGAWIQLT